MEAAGWHDAGVDDRSVVDAVLAGNRDQFRHIVDEAQGPVYRVCLRVLGSAADAEDAAQESFVTAFRTLGTYRGDGPLTAWLVRIATRTAYRRLGQRRPNAELEAASHIRSASPDPLQAALSAERRAAVRAAVARLSEPYREVVTLRYFGELSLEEVAAATGRNLNTVKTQVRRGLERLSVDIGEVAA
jgi:RNA polymerase sigma-70 factor (ECF subfamily)